MYLPPNAVAERLVPRDAPADARPRLARRAPARPSRPRALARRRASGSPSPACRRDSGRSRTRWRLPRTRCSFTSSRRRSGRGGSSFGSGFRRVSASGRSHPARRSMQPPGRSTSRAPPVLSTWSSGPRRVALVRRGERLAAATAAVALLLAYGARGGASAARSTVLGKVRIWKIAYRAHNGDRRNAFVMLPRSYRPGHAPPIPLVISPHGRGVTGRGNLKLWGQLPAVGGFAVVSPDGQGRLLPTTRGDRPGRSPISHACRRSST